MTAKRKTVFKTAATVILSLCNAFLIYCMSVCLYLWQNQPHFILPDGAVTTSMGYLITFYVYAGIFAAAAIVQIVFSFLAYRRKKPAAAKQPAVIPAFAAAEALAALDTPAE